MRQPIQRGHGHVLLIPSHSLLPKGLPPNLCRIAQVFHKWIYRGDPITQIDGARFMVPFRSLTSFLRGVELLRNR